MVDIVNAISGNTVLLFNIVMVVLGAYLLYATRKMKTSGVIPTLFMAPEELRKLKDKQGFIAMVYRPQMVLAVVFILLGLLDVFFEYVVPFAYYGYVELVVFLVTFAWYGKAFHDAREKYISPF